MEGEEKGIFVEKGEGVMELWRRDREGELDLEED